MNKNFKTFHLLVFAIEGLTSTGIWALGFDTDNQTVSATVYGQGSGSCGVGVILAAKDFIEQGSKAVNNLSWKYKVHAAAQKTAHARSNSLEVNCNVCCDLG